ncbi:TPA: prepilin peptidase [Enterobacter cloacae]|uniref:prepilin peptidase n=1 Tax=Enterobacter TaxID=547 RepID=UPI001251429B|nr:MULTISPECIES: prepilin peptidase [Enterobacter]HCR1911922.1 prepilin peptidase [Enterobacter kobei]ELK7333531.1 prepilin peptidase [Enterobacter cloacae]MCC4549324.1 prepilin peptidase [Enterobacter hormaechei]MCC4558250.1 prepilin peptidase [Enterobacter hormaechei]MCC4562750.1 prepilin peptidase [Enterobacter hormaechei]
MRTIIVTSLTTVWSLPLLLGFALIGRGLMCRVLDFLEENPMHVREQKTTLTAGIWLFATFSMIAALAPGPVADRAAAIMMMAFLLQAGSTDAVSGYLPRTFTVRLLLGGLLWRAASDVTVEGISIQLAEIAATGSLMALLGVLVNRGAQRLGQGDLWLITGLTAWMGGKDAALVTLFGVTAFVLWLLTWHLSGKKEGPLGPWLCLSGSIFQLTLLYQPVWISIL